MSGKLEGSSRWLLLLLSTGAMTCCYLAFDQPSALKNNMQQELDLSDIKYNMVCVARSSSRGSCSLHYH